MLLDVSSETDWGGQCWDFQVMASSIAFEESQQFLSTLYQGFAVKNLVVLGFPGEVISC